MEPDTDDRVLGLPAREDSGPSLILSLVSDTANRTVLETWITRHEPYELVPHTSDILIADFDCAIVDTPALLERKDDLLSRKDHEELLLPIILLVEQEGQRHPRSRLRREHPTLADAINAVVEMPIREYSFADQLESLLQMREQSGKILAQQAQLQVIRDEHAGHGVLITDREGRIQYVNTAFEQQSGYSAREVIGENPRILQSGEHEESFYEDLWETILAGEVWQGEVINERKDGDTYVLNQTIAPITNVDGDIERFIAVNHEITKLKDFEASLRSQREQLEILNRVLRHDIRNDMNVIIGWMDIVGEYVGEEGEEYVARITNSAGHIVELTEVAGDLVEAITTDSDPELEPIAIASVLDEEIEKRREAFSDATIEFDNEVSSRTRVRANSMLPSVFRNLINNGVQHNNSTEPRVEIHSECEDQSVIVTVADNGPGIPDTAKDTIFDKSEKGLDSPGTGMGLFLVQSLVDTYGGVVWIADNEPHGAVFGVELPVVPDDSASPEVPNDKHPCEP